jgi:hypothetical protein
MKKIVQKLVQSHTSKLTAATEHESLTDHQNNSTDANKTAPKKTDHAKTVKNFIDTTGAQMKKTVETVIKGHLTKFNAIHETISQGKNDTLKEKTHQ